MARNSEGQPVFCDDCTAKGDYSGPLKVDDFSLVVEATPGGEVGEREPLEHGYTLETLGYFAHQPEDDMVPLATETIGNDEVLGDTAEAHIYVELAGWVGEGEPQRPSRERELGQRMCEYVGACTGMQVRDGSPVCPAFNTATLDRAAAFVFARSYGAEAENL